MVSSGKGISGCWPDDWDVEVVQLWSIVVGCVLEEVRGIEVMNKFVFNVSTCFLSFFVYFCFDFLLLYVVAM